MFQISYYLRFAPQFPQLEDHF